MKYCGKIGFARTVETVPGVWEEQIEEKEYFGEVIKNTRNSSNSQYLNDNFTISNQFRIVSDPYSFREFPNIRYIEFMGVKWKVASADIDHPGILLTVGGIYNGE